MVLLLLLWIFIDNCTTSAQRICAKLAIVDCMMIKSPMIQQYMPEFLNYIQDKLLFMTNDFNPIYIHHLSTLAINNLENEQIISFYECEKKCFRSRNVPELLVNNLNEVAEINFNIPTRLENMIQIYHLLRRYDNVADFPVWYFAPLWKKIASYQYEKYTNNAACSTLNNYSDIFNPTDDPLIYLFTFTDFNVISAYIYEIENENDRIEMNLIEYKNENYGKLVLQPNERKRVVWNVAGSGDLKIEMYKLVTHNDISYNTLMSDIQLFAVDWTDSDTEDLMLEYASIFPYCDDIEDILLRTLNLQDLVNKYNTRVVQCKFLCLYFYDQFYSNNSLNEYNHANNQNEKRIFGQRNSRFFSYKEREEHLSIIKTPIRRSIARTNSYDMINLYGHLILDADSSIRLLTGQSNDYKDSMIYQISKPIEENLGNRFEHVIWGIRFKGRNAIDASGVTNDAITLSVNSFLYPKTGICIISPNITDNTPSIVNSSNIVSNLGDTQIIPYPLQDEDPDMKRMLFAFGSILGSLIRSGFQLDIPFPLFVWNGIAGKPITKEDVYENDTRLKDEIESMKSGAIDDHHWIYRDWNNTIKPIIGFPENKIVTKDMVDIYEALVIDLRIKSLQKVLNQIRRGFLFNQQVAVPDMISGGLLMYLCRGRKTLNNKEIVSRIIFENGNDVLKRNFKSVVENFDQTQMRDFLLFTTAKPRPPNFSIVPDYHITVRFLLHMGVTALPESHACFNIMDSPYYPNIEIMREKVLYAITYAKEMDRA